MTTTVKGRHRASARALTPLTGSAPAARRGLAVAASSGLALTMIAAGATAADGAAKAGASAESLPAAGLASLATEAREAVTTNAEVTVAADAAFTDEEVPEVTAEAPAPEPEPVVVAAPAAAPARTQDQAAATRQQAPQQEAAAEVEAAAPVAAAPAATGGIVGIASQYIGVPYVWGGTTPSGFDCSGFVQYVYGQAGISMPRTSYAQGAAGHRVSAAEAQPGDLVFYGGHIGIYAGNGMMIHAPRPGKTVSMVPVYGSPSYVRVG